jgi:hypothetical protein
MEALSLFQNSSYCTQFWCLPVSEDVRAEGLFESIVEAQMKNANRLFDV